MANNPYSDDTENPFADPSVTSMSSNAARGIEDFNPFAEQSQPGQGPSTKSTIPAPTTSPPPQPQTRTQPAIIETRQEPPAYSVVEEQENLRKRQEDLERKAAELQRKEQELQNMQFTGYRENNFPPCKPCFYHDIQVEIPIEHQKTCKYLFLRWQAYSLVMVYNFLTALALLIVNPTTGATDGETFGISIAYLLINVPASFLCWYRPAYKALRSDSSFSYIIFFLIYFLHIGLNIFYCLGIAGGGTCGFINAALAFKKSPPVGAMMFICACFFVIGFMIDIFLLMKANENLGWENSRAGANTCLRLMFALTCSRVLPTTSRFALACANTVHRIYRAAGASFEKAQGEFAKGVASNQHVQAAATEAAVSGVKGAMSNKK